MSTFSRRLLLVACGLLAAGAVVVGVGVWGLLSASSLAQLAGSEPFAAPGSQTLSLNEGAYDVMVSGGSGSVVPADVTVRAAEGGSVEILRGHSRTSVEREGARYSAAAVFTVMRGGVYTVTVEPAADAQVLVLPSTANVIGSAAVWVLVVVIGSGLVLSAIATAVVAVLFPRRPAPQL